MSVNWGIQDLLAVLKTKSIHAAPRLEGEQLMSNVVEDSEWDVYYKNEWVGAVYAITYKEAMIAAKWEFEAEPWDFSKLTVRRNQEND